MATQLQYQSHATLTLEQNKCYICGQPAVEEIKQFQMHFCQTHLDEAKQVVTEWANSELRRKNSYIQYVSHREWER